MKRLKCPDCGGSVKLLSSEEGHVLGRCTRCASEFVIDAKGRQHIIVEHRFPNGAPRPVAAAATASPSRRVMLGLCGAAVLGTGAMLLGQRRSPTGGGKAAPMAEVLFNVGGEGAAAGQFRDHVFDIGIDSLGRAALVDNRDRVYVFGPEGQFITHYSLTEKTKGKFCAVLPSGDLILAGDQRLRRLALETGELIEEVRPASDPRGWGASYANTAEGGIAAYSTDGHGFGSRTETVPRDRIVVYGPDLKEKRVLSGFLAQAIAPDPMVSEWPRVTAIEVDAAGSIFLNIKPSEDNDPRGGIFEFNADSRLLRRIEVAQAWQGRLAITPDTALWYGDAWRSDLQRISLAGRQVFPLSGLAATRDEALGNVAAFAAYPNGDLGVVTMNHRFVRLRPRLEAAAG